MAHDALILGQAKGRGGGRDEANGGSTTSVRQNCEYEEGGGGGVVEEGGGVVVELPGGLWFEKRSKMTTSTKILMDQSEPRVMRAIP